MFALLYKSLITNSLWYQKKEEGEFPFGIEDLLYYVKRVEEQSYDLDFGEIKQYLPISLVLTGIFKIVQDFFGNFISDYLFVLVLLPWPSGIMLVWKVTRKGFLVIYIASLGIINHFTMFIE